MTPYNNGYGQSPLSMESYVPSTLKVHVVDITLHVKETILPILMDNFFMAQNRMKQKDNKHHS